MGIAASQARYLSLTARKSNVEFQGQMVNQARTNLANESANIYNEMMMLKTPTVPSVYDYYEDLGAFEVSYSSGSGSTTECYIDSFSETSTAGNYNVNFKYYLNGVEQRFVGTADLVVNDGATIPSSISNITIPDGQVSDSMKTALEGTTASVYSQNVYDEAAYDEALKKSENEQAVYNQRIQELNARTEQLQIEDRTLELQLRQLDTEQDALQTELDAVKKVIEKNVETVFKTFQD